MRPQEIGPDFVADVRPTVGRVDIGGEAVLLDSATGVLHRLEPLGAIVWSCFDGSGTVDEISEDLSAEFGAARGEVCADVVGLARQLGELGLLSGVVAPWEEPTSGETVATPVEISDPEPRFLVEPPSS